MHTRIQKLLPITFNNGDSNILSFKRYIPIRFRHGLLNGCETWSITLREESRLRVFENRVLRSIFGPKRDQVTGQWRKVHKCVA
jgi:hypothetical protein